MATVWSNECKLLGPPPHNWSKRTSLATNAMLVAINGACEKGFLCGSPVSPRWSICVLSAGHKGPCYSCPQYFTECRGGRCRNHSGPGDVV